MILISKNKIKEISKLVYNSHSYSSETILSLLYNQKQNGSRRNGRYGWNIQASYCNSQKENIVRIQILPEILIKLFNQKSLVM